MKLHWVYNYNSKSFELLEVDNETDYFTFGSIEAGLSDDKNVLYLAFKQWGPYQQGSSFIGEFKTWETAAKAVMDYND